jgi:predicted nucleotidyltransferase
VSAVVYSIDELRSKIAPIARRYDLPAVYIFGSYARNEATEDSDVDILIDRTGSVVKGMVIGGLYNDLCESIGKGIDLVTTATLEQECTKRDTPWFVDNLMKERVLLYERQ